MPCVSLRIDHAEQRRVASIEYDATTALPCAPCIHRAGESASTAVPTPTAAPALFTRLRYAHFQRATLEFAPVELLDRILCLGVGAHLHEAEPARLAAELVGDDRR